MLRNLICALKRLKLCPQFRKSCPERRDTKTYQNKRENSCQRIRARCSNGSGDSVAIAITHPNQSNAQCNPQHCPNQLPDILIRSRTNGHSNGDRSGTGRQRPSSCAGAFKACHPALNRTIPPAIRKTPIDIPKKLRMMFPANKQTSNTISEYNPIRLAIAPRI